MLFDYSKSKRIRDNPDSGVEVLYNMILLDVSINLEHSQNIRKVNDVSIRYKLVFNSITQ